MSEQGVEGRPRLVEAGPDALTERLATGRRIQRRAQRLLQATVSLFVLTLPQHSTAGKTADAAELKRLAAEAEGLAQRGAWTGVNRSYLALAELQSKGTPVSSELHILGARAAQELGDLKETYLRLVRARQAQDGLSDEIEMWIAKLDSEYQLVHIVALPSWKAPLTLVNKDMSFVPAHKSTIDKAITVLEAEREFTGLLPHGRYTVGPENFELIGGPRIEVVLKKSGPWEQSASEPSPAVPLPVEPSPAPRLTQGPTAMVVSLRQDFEDPVAFGEATESLKQDILGLVDVVKVTVHGIRSCNRVELASRSDLEPVQNALIPHGVLLQTDPPVFTMSLEAGHPAALPIDDDQTVGDVATISRSWCDAPGLRRVEITIDAGVDLEHVTEELSAILQDADPSLEAQLP